MMVTSSRYGRISGSELRSMTCLSGMNSESEASADQVPGPFRVRIIRLAGLGVSLSHVVTVLVQ